MKSFLLSSIGVHIEKMLFKFDQWAKFEIPAPPLPEQKKIARILSTVDRKLELIDQQITATQTLKKGLMQKLFSEGVGTQDANGQWQPHAEFKDSELGRIPAGWEVKTIAQSTEYVDYRGKTPPKSESGIFLVTAKNIKKGFIDYECSKEFVPVETYGDVMSRGKPDIGDVLITTEAPLGNVAQVDNANVAIAQRVIKYRPNTGVDSSYLKQYFLSDTFQSRLALESTGTTVKGIKGSRLHKLLVLLPPQNEQIRIASTFNLVETKLNHFLALKKQTQQLKKGLMQKLLTGQIRVQPDPQDV
ncbi:restriction endonuclease subunit S [Sansalvadorimonas verongulae]|nr:restriction endonuclease subunit S [Sansalvadorimonas verongulae]